MVEYNDRLLILQTEFDGELNKLIDTAIKDYNSGVSKVKLANKYLGEGTKLEKSSDEKFYALLGKMEKELGDNSLDTQVSRDVAKYYETFKKEKKTELINKGMNIVKE